MIKTTREFSYQAITTKTNHWEATEWCEKNFGPRWEAIDNRNGSWCTFWKGRGIPGSYEWYFEQEKDYLMFLLKWT